jgi:hypothetical protein
MMREIGVRTETEIVLVEIAVPPLLLPLLALSTPMPPSARSAVALPLPDRLLTNMQMTSRTGVTRRRRLLELEMRTAADGRKERTKEMIDPARTPDSERRKRSSQEQLCC